MPFEKASATILRPHDLMGWHRDLDPVVSAATPGPAGTLHEGQAGRAVKARCYAGSEWTECNFNLRNWSGSEAKRSDSEQAGWR